VEKEDLALCIDKSKGDPTRMFRLFNNIAHYTQSDCFPYAHRSFCGHLSVQRYQSINLISVADIVTYM
jgi:hypothetical protein